jgi:hypothetical protein
MANSVLDLTLTDIGQISTFVYPDYLLDGPLAGLNSVIKPSVFATRCFTKLPFQLRFSVNSTLDFSFDSNVSFDIEFLGQDFTLGPNPTPMGPNGSHESDVAWTGNWVVDQRVDRDFHWKGQTLHIDNVQGLASSKIVQELNNARSYICGEPTFPLTSGLEMGLSGGVPALLTLNGSLNGTPFQNVFGVGLQLYYGDQATLPHGRLANDFTVEITKRKEMFWWIGEGGGPDLSASQRQATYAISIHEIANLLSDSEYRKELQNLAMKIAVRHG